MGEGWNSMGSPNEAATEPGPGPGGPGPGTGVGNVAVVDPPPPPLAEGTQQEDASRRRRSSSSRSSSSSSSSSGDSSTNSSSSSRESGTVVVASAASPGRATNGKHGGRRWKADHQPLRKPSIAEVDEEEEEDEGPIEEKGQSPMVVGEAEEMPRPEVVVTPTRNITSTTESEDDEAAATSKTPGASPTTTTPPNQPPQDHYCLRWTNHGSHVLGVFAQLLRDESLVDVTLAAEGRSLRAHKMVLSACSSFFRTLFVTHSDQRHPIVILKDTKFTELQSLLQFMYKGEVSVEYGQLATLLKTAENLRVKGLADVTTTAAAAAAAATAPPPKKAEDDDEEEEEDEEEEDEDEDMFDDDDVDDVDVGPIVIERNALTSGLSGSVDRIHRNRRRHRHLHHNPYRRSLQPHPHPPLSASGSTDALANHHRLVHRHHRGIVDSPLDLHPAIQDLSSSSAALDRRRHHRRTSQSTNHLIPPDWQPPEELQHPPRRQLKPSNHHHHQQQQQQQPADNANEPAVGKNASGTTGTGEKRTSDRDPDDGDHNHRFKASIRLSEHNNAAADGQRSSASTPLDSMAQDSGTAQDLRRGSRMPPSPQSLSPSSPPPQSGPATGAANPHHRFRHWMMEESEESEEVDEDDDEAYLHQSNNASGAHHPPSAPIGSPQHLPMVNDSPPLRLQWSV